LRSTRQDFAVTNDQPINSAEFFVWQRYPQMVAVIYSLDHPMAIFWAKKYPGLSMQIRVR
jgi:hypothetical protein